MPLTAFQAWLGRLLAENRSEDSYLAGGAAILAAPNTHRYSRDLDYFHDSESRVASAFAADRDLLDALFLHEHLLPLGALVWAAAGKDPGYTPRQGTARRPGAA